MSSADWLARYQPWRRGAEIGFWVLVLGTQAIFDTLVTWIDLRRSLPEFPLWQPLSWELTSTAVVGALIPVIARFERHHPLRLGTLRTQLPWHLAGSVAYCLAHIAGMVVLRKFIYLLAGSRYEPGRWLSVFGYEYLKDVRSYLMILAALWTYRFVLLRVQGEARLLDAPEAPAGAVPAPVASPAAAPARPERFLVRKLRKEFLIAAADIEWLQAQANYVGLHVNGHDYLLRSTLADLVQQLDPARFARVHRSYVVNLDRIAEIEPQEGGEARLKMKDGSFVPCSRRYRDALGAA
jgi:hypothetical protein